MYHEPLPIEVLQLQTELKNWPMITAEAQKCGSLAEALGTIAARIGVLLDGTYDVPDLCGMLTKKLYEMRTSAIYVPDLKFKEVRIREGANEVILENVPTELALPQSQKKED